MTDISKDRLLSFIERIERLEEEKKAIADDVKDVYAESKGAGFDPKALKAIIRRRKDPEAAAELEAIINSYVAALGWARTPLGGSISEGVTVQ